MTATVTNFFQGCQQVGVGASEFIGPQTLKHPGGQQQRQAEVKHRGPLMRCSLGALEF